jgi:hypothetical protein
VTNRITKSALDQALASVEGWLGADEAWALHEAGYAAGSTKPDPVVVELGSWKGRSTIALASGLAAAEHGTVHAVDPHAGTRTHARSGESDTWGAFSANVRRAGLQDFVEPIRCESHVARERFAAGSVHLLFVDASHRFEDVIRDIDDWTPALTDGATVAFHDTVHSRGVGRALRKRVLSRGCPFHEARLVQGTLFVRYDPSAANGAAAWLRIRVTMWKLGLFRDVALALRPLRPKVPHSIESWGRRLFSRASGGAIGE